MSGAPSGGETTFKFGGEVDQLLAAISRAETEIKGFVDQVKEVTPTFAAIGEAIAAAFTVDKVFEFIDAMAQLGRDTQQTAQRLGETVEQVTAFNFVARQSGIGAREAEVAQERFALSIEKGAAGIKQQKAAFDALGISQQFLKDHMNDLAAVQDKVADAFASHADGPAKAAAAIELYGRAGANMIPILDRGSAGLAEFRAKAEELGAIMSPQLVADLAETDEKIVDLQTSVQVAGVNIMSVFKPAIDAAIDGLTDLVKGFNDAIKNGGLFKNILELIDTAAAAVIITIREVIFLLYAFGQTVQIVIESAVKAIAALGQVLYDVFTADFQKARDDAVNALADIEKNAINRVGNIANAFAKLGQVVANALNLPGAAAPPKPAGPQGGGGLPNPVASPGGGGANHSADQVFAAKQREADQLANIGIEAAKQEELAKIAIAKDEAQTEYELGKITKEQLLELQGQFDQQTIQANEQAVNERIAALAREVEAYKARYGEASATFQKFNAQATVELAKLRAELQKLATEAQVSSLKIGNAIRVEVAQPMKQVIATITQGLGQAFQGLITRTMTWGQAFRTVLNSAAAALTQFVQKKVEQWIQSEILETTTSETQETVRQANQAASQAASLAQRAGFHAITIAADASEVFGGVFANLAPSMGPWAAGPAAASMASVIAAGAVGFEVGAWEIPGNMLANIHKGEMIIPANFASGLRDMMAGHANGAGRSSGGGDVHHWHITAMDARGVEGFVKRQRTAFMRGMKSAQRDGGYAVKSGYGTSK